MAAVIEQGEAAWRRLLTEGIVTVATVGEAKALAQRLDRTLPSRPHAHWGGRWYLAKKPDGSAHSYDVEACQGAHCHCRY